MIVITIRWYLDGPRVSVNSPSSTFYVQFIPEAVMCDAGSSQCNLKPINMLSSAKNAREA